MAQGGGIHAGERSWDHSTYPEFYEYYANESESEATARRFQGILMAVLRVASRKGMSGSRRVADVGCGAGAQARLWARHGHRVFALDVNAPLIDLARARTAQAGLNVSFEVGTATQLPWADGSMDVCLIPELLEHIVDWRACLNEAARVLRQRGLLYLSTTNALCPRQSEFNLPLYSWYPARLKRHCEHLALTTRPAIANYAKYPALHWFTFYGLRAFLEPLGFECLDRFDLVDASGKSSGAKLILSLLQTASPLRFLGHVATRGTHLIAVRKH